MTVRKGGARVVRGKFFARVRLEKDRRPSIPLTGCTTKAEADARAAEIAAMADAQIEAGRWFAVEEIARAMGAAVGQKALRVIRTTADRIAASASRPLPADVTFATFAERWTSGQLARDFPDHVPAKDSRGDVGIFSLHVNPVVGHIPLVAFTLEHADSVMRLVPVGLGSARRRHIAQVVHRVLALASFPAKVIPLSPLPKGWLPKIGKGKALTYLYPDEDRKLLASPAVPIARRMLYGFLTREGMRLSEALALEWSDLDLARGAVNLDDNKTDDPRAWALDPTVTSALAWWKLHGPKAGPFAGISANHAARLLRTDLEAAGVDRAALFATTDKRRPLRIHDLRATFVTVALATGRTESWVQDRTGHTSTFMIARYRRASRTVAELGLGTLAPLAEAIPEVMGGDQVGQHTTEKRGKKDAKMASDSSLVAPAGLEPARPSGPEILKPRDEAPIHTKPRQSGGGRSVSRGLGKADPQGDPHPTQALTRGLVDDGEAPEPVAENEAWS